jgi:(E)-benzylidenesuccinyl-CoA hydratase
MTAAVTARAAIAMAGTAATEFSSQMAIIFERRDGIAKITLNRPEVLNALDPQTYAEITDAFVEIERDPAVRVGIVTGAGERAFTAGADLKLMHTGASDPAEWAPWRADRWDFGLTTSKPLIAAVNGYALAGGLELALVCDIRIASPNATFGTPEVKWNLLHGYGAYRLPRIISPSHAMEMLLTGEFIDAPTALRIGLVSRVVPAGDLQAQAWRIAERIAANGPMAVRMTKELVQHGLSASPAEHFRLMREYYSRVDATADQAEGLRAFAEKRRPRYGDE